MEEDTESITSESTENNTSNNNTLIREISMKKEDEVNMNEQQQQHQQQQQESKDKEEGEVKHKQKDEVKEEVKEEEKEDEEKVMEEDKHKEEDEKKAMEEDKHKDEKKEKVMEEGKDYQRSDNELAVTSDKNNKNIGHKKPLNINIKDKNFFNYLFYAGIKPSEPDEVYIDEFHFEWWYMYDRLEDEHGFIQWLFPVFESSGMNWEARRLGKEEAKLIREDFNCSVRFLRSYKMMLNFYGLVLIDEETGTVQRHPTIWQPRYRNLERYGHNNLRINRILTCLSHLGFKRYKVPLLEHFHKEIIENGLLLSCKNSYLRFWRETIKYETDEYTKKTKEKDSDREDSIFFIHMANKTEEYLVYIQQEQARELSHKEIREKTEAQQLKQTIADARRQQTTTTTTTSTTKQGSQSQTKAKQTDKKQKEKKKWW